MNGTVLYNAHQKSTYIYLYLYICICAFVVEYTERFHERNGSLNGTVPWMEQFRINHTKSQPTYIYTNMYVNGTVLWMERFRERNGSVNGTVLLNRTVLYNAHQKSTYIYLYLYICICAFVVEYMERFHERNGSLNGTVPWTERFRERNGSVNGTVLWTERFRERNGFVEQNSFV